MSNSWLCTRAKLLQICQIRSITNLSWFQNRNNTISLDIGSCTAGFQDDSDLLKTNLAHSSVSHGSLDNTFFEWKDRSALLQTVDGACGKPDAFNTMSKYDILTFLRPLGVRNQDLIKSLAKIVEPLECHDTIHVDSSSKHYKQPCKKANIHAFSSFDAFSPADEQLLKDFNHCLHMNASNAALKTKDRSWHANKSGSGSSGGKDPDKDDESKGPTINQLETVKEYYEQIIPGFHKRGEQLSAGVHHKEMVFENHFFKKPKETVGLHKYSLEVSKMRMMASFLYPSYFLEIQSITTHPSNGYVKMHWRAYVLSNIRFVTHFFSLFKGMASGGSAKDIHDTIDGISTFHLNKDGKIVLHRLDRKLPIQNAEASPVKNLAAKTVEMVGLTPKANCKSTSKENL